MTIVVNVIGFAVCVLLLFTERKHYDAKYYKTAMEDWENMAEYYESCWRAEKQMRIKLEKKLAKKYPDSDYYKLMKLFGESCSDPEKSVEFARKIGMTEAQLIEILDEDVERFLNEEA